MKLLSTKIIKCPFCGGTDFTAHSNWIFTQEFIGGKFYPEFADIIKSRTITRRVVCIKCKKKVPRLIFKRWHLDQTVM